LSSRIASTTRRRGSRFEPTVSQIEVAPDRDPEDLRRFLGFPRALFGRSARTHLPGGQVDDSGAITRRLKLQERSAHDELDVVGMRSEGDDVDGHRGGF
jgi:hypothetical protein